MFWILKKNIKKNLKKIWKNNVYFEKICLRVQEQMLIFMWQHNNTDSILQLSELVCQANGEKGRPHS